MDTNGTIIWSKRFRNYSPLKDIRITSVTLLPNNEFLLSAMSCDYNQYYGHKQDSTFSLLIKLDSNRNELWRIRLGNLKTRNLSPNPILLDDGNYLVSWTNQELNKLNRTGYVRLHDSSTLHISKISQNGHVIWEKNLHHFLTRNDNSLDWFYPNKFYPYNLWQMRKLKNGNIALIGNTYTQGFMLMLNKNGNPLWYRSYYPPSQLPILVNKNSDNGIKGMIETMDGGFLLTGYSWYGGYNVPTWGRQSAFVYKTDQYGCLTPGCHKKDQWYIDSFDIKLPDLVDINPNVYDSVKNDTTNSKQIHTSLLVFPNPSNGEIKITLPSSLDLSKPVKITIYSSNGKLITTIELTDYTTRLSLENVSKGIYILQFEGNSFSESKKIVFY